MSQYISSGAGDYKLSTDNKESTWMDNIAKSFRSGAGKFADQIKLGFDNAGQFIKDNPEMAGMMAKSVEDMFSRGQIGELAAVEAATSPFAKGSIVDAFSKGPGGFDPISDVMEARALQEQRADRDRLFKILEGRVAKGAEAGRAKTDILDKKIQERLKR